ncbi:MAG: hypothetical protein PUJ42_00445 [Bacteroidales bacterium]|nr:hypothetical protein [Bacteroidales bacterium]MDD7659158.1 hypothetical protein [Bacteroidales bacterium]
MTTRRQQHRRQARKEVADGTGTVSHFLVYGHWKIRSTDMFAWRSRHPQPT